MTRPLNILFASPEAHPFAKTGGLGDVSSALPLALKQQGHDVRVILPKYRSVEQAKRSIKQTGLTITVPIGLKIKSGELHEGRLNRTMPVYFVGQDEYFDRDGFYGDAEGEFPDNAERFISSRARYWKPARRSTSNRILSTATTGKPALSPVT